MLKLKKNPIFLSVVIVVVMLIQSAPAEAITGETVLDKINWGAKAEDAAKLLKAKGLGFELLKVNDKQAISKAMIKNGLLETFNNIGICDIFLPDAKGPKARSFIVFKYKERSYSLLFSDNGLFQVYVRNPIYVDKNVSKGSNPFTQSRLNPLRTRLQQLTRDYSLRATKRDRHGNAFLYMGSNQNGWAASLYLPGKDELRIVYSKSTPRIRSK